MRFSLSLLMVVFALGLGACSTLGLQKEAKYPSGEDQANTGGDIYTKGESIFGKGGLKIFGKDEEKDDNGIGVNSFLWRASLDTVSFMPLASADPFGGVILTDWYSPAAEAEEQTERFKINLFILSRALRSDGIRVRVFKQQLVEGIWKDIEPGKNTARALEDTILTRARQLRVAQLGAEEE